MLVSPSKSKKLKGTVNVHRRDRVAGGPQTNAVPCARLRSMQSGCIEAENFTHGREETPGRSLMGFAVRCARSFSKPSQAEMTASCEGTPLECFGYL
jgi:hypothetical protein